MGQAHQGQRAVGLSQPAEITQQPARLPGEQIRPGLTGVQVTAQVRRVGEAAMEMIDQARHQAGPFPGVVLLVFFAQEVPGVSIAKGGITQDRRGQRHRQQERVVLSTTSLSLLVTLHFEATE